MKRGSGTAVGLCVLAVGALLSLAVASVTQEKSGKVEIKEDVIIIHPGSKISKSDTAALNEVLRKYDKSLYKIETYGNGKLKKRLGELSDMLIDQTVASELASAKESGGSDRSIQVISPNGPQGPNLGPVNPQRTAPSPMPNGPQMTPSSPMPAGPQMPPSTPTPNGPQMTPAGPQMTPNGPQQSPVPVKPRDDKAYKQLIERLKPILEKYSK